MDDRGDSTPVIRVVGARAHNLASATVNIPRGRLTVVTGVSGSGKSSLAFDTLYAEGQRRYVEALSTRARQFLEQLARPDVDRIDGLPPTLAVEQRLAVAGPRSTVGTVTEIHDFLRVLFARVGQPHCWVCGRAIVRSSIARIVDAVRSEPPGTRVLLLAPLSAAVRAAALPTPDAAIKLGFVRARIGGEVRLIEELQDWPTGDAVPVQIVTDRLVIKDDVAPRLAESLESAARLSGGRILVVTEGKDAPREQFFSTTFACPEHESVAIEEVSPALLSFNAPQGSCRTCTGLGVIFDFDESLVVPDPQRSLAEGAIEPWRRLPRGLRKEADRRLREFCGAAGLSLDAPFRTLESGRRRMLMHGTTPSDARRHGASFDGVLPTLARIWTEDPSSATRRALAPFRGERTCPACHGARLGVEALSPRLGGCNIAEICRMTIGDARRFFDEFSAAPALRPVADPLLNEIRHRLAFLVDVGVDYLTLDRRSETLSGGEAQRIRLATHVGTGLVGVCYVLDEPTVGLHPRDTDRLLNTIRALTRSDNTVVIVEHDDRVIAAADHVIDFGPGPGDNGGRVVFEGSVDALRACKNSLTGRYLSGELMIPRRTAHRTLDPQRSLTLRGVRAHNLANLDVRIPLGGLVCVTGVSGSGKSTLVNHVLYPALRRRLDGSGPLPGEHDELLGVEYVDKVIRIDQTPLGRSSRSNPATYVGAFDELRRLFAATREAKVRGYGPARFSFNAGGGRCEACAGQGEKRIEMHFLPDVYVTCESCGGRRFNRETLDVRFRGRTIADVLDLRVEEAAGLFASFPKLHRLLGTLKAVGLGYITLGQPSDTLSGGEAQRLKLAAELARPAAEHTLYILDEPTRGLHPADVNVLLGVLARLIERGGSVLVIEHHLDFIRSADWVIDLGPEAGPAGGRLVAEGPPENLARHPESRTGRFLAQREGPPCES
ncbi:MAG: UvrABC system protein A [Planctomycetota bacterium]|nr:MAG: UvrABC system protein A [Planctomycetota bacterium]